MTRALPSAFCTLSSYTPRPVSWCAIRATSSALSYTYLPRARTMASTCSCEKLSKTAWATRARATSRRTWSGVVEDEAFTLAPRAISAVGLTMRVSFPGWWSEGLRRRPDRRRARRSSAERAPRWARDRWIGWTRRRLEHRRTPRHGATERCGGRVVCQSFAARVCGSVCPVVCRPFHVPRLCHQGVEHKVDWLDTLCRAAHRSRAAGERCRADRDGNRRHGGTAARSARLTNSTGRSAGPRVDNSTMPSDSPCRAQGGDVLLSVADLKQHRVGVRAQLAGCRLHARPAMPQAEGSDRHRQLAVKTRCGTVPMNHNPGGDLRIGQRLLHPSDAAGGNAVSLEECLPLVRPLHGGEGVCHSLFLGVSRRTATGVNAPAFTVALLCLFHSVSGHLRAIVGMHVGIPTGMRVWRSSGAGRVIGPHRVVRDGC